MHDSAPIEAARSGWSRWAVVTLLGVLVAVASGAAVMASRSMARAPQAVPVAESKVAAASAPVAGSKSVAPVKAPSGASDATLAAVRGQPGSDEATAPAGRVARNEGAVTARASAVAPEADTDDAVDPPSTSRSAARRQAPVLRRVAAAPRRPAGRAAAPEETGAVPAKAEVAEPVTVDVQDLPEAPAEAPPPAPVRQAPKQAAGDGDLVIEDGPPKVAFLSVDASPYATVFIDGEKKGVTPLLRMELPPGLHRMIAKTEDGRTKRFTLQLEPGKTETVKVAWEE
jgi:hypothetical protein